MSQSGVKRIIDRKLSSGIGEQLVVFIIIFVLSLLLVTFCYWLLGVGNGFVDSVAKSFADFFGGDQYSNYAYPNETASDIAPWVKWVTLVACIIGSIVFQGLLIATLTNAIQSRAEKVQNGDIRYKFNGHYLIMGYDFGVPALVKRLCKTSVDVVVVVEKDVAECRNTLSDSVGKKKNVFVLRGEMSSIECLESLYVSNAKQIFILGSDNTPDRDLLNLDCYRTINNTIAAGVDCYVRIYNQAIYETIVHSGEIDIQHFHPYNFEEIWARKLLVDSENIYQKPDFLSSHCNVYLQPEKQVHFVIIGFTAMGEALCREAALLMHYPNYITHGIKTKITCIASNIAKDMQSFVGRHKTLFDCCGCSLAIIDAMGVERKQMLHPAHTPTVCDIEFEFIDANPQNIFVMQRLSSWSDDNSQLMSIAICEGGDTTNYQHAQSLLQSLWNSNVPIFVYQRKKLQFNNMGTDRLNYFGFEDIDVTMETKEVGWGRYVNYIYSQLYGNGQVAMGEKLDSEAARLWGQLSLDKRWSNIYNASSLPFKLRGIGIESVSHLKDNKEKFENSLEILSEVEHNRWNVEQRLHGYRPTTEEEHMEIIANPSKKKEYKRLFVHDDIRPYAELDDYTKGKDTELLRHLTTAVIQ